MSAAVAAGPRDETPPPPTLEPARAPWPARLADRTLDLAVLALAAWTVAYHAAVILHLRAGTAAALAAVLLVAAAGWLRDRGGRAATGRVVALAAPAAAHRPLVLAGALAAAAAAVLFAFGHPPWLAVWALAIVAAACALLAAGGDVPRVRASWLEPVVVFVWVVGLAGLSLLLLGPDGDDTFYVHLSSWIGAHGSFPVKDVLFTDQRIPSLYFPPVAAYDPLLGTVAHLTPLEAPDVAYFVVPPLAAAGAVLAQWRLLRTWRVQPAWVALSVALAFLVLDADSGRNFGAFFVGRIWQGKAVFLCVLVPLLLALLHERRSLALVAAAGVASVGLTTSAMFVVPVIAAGAMLARPSPKAFAAASAYPLAAGVATLTLGGRTPDVYATDDVLPADLAHYVLGNHWLALLGLGAALAGPLAVPRRSGAMLAAGVVLVVTLLLTPAVPALILHATGLGRVLWRLLWAIPVAALLGALAVRLRFVPLVVIAAALVAGAAPMWTLEGGPRRYGHPVWKRPPAEVATAKAIVAHAHAGDVVLAPAGLSQTLAVIDGTVYPVSTRDFYTETLAAVPGGQMTDRLLLVDFAAGGLHPGQPNELRAAAVTHALRALRVAVACVPARYAAARRLLHDQGYADTVETGGLACARHN